MLECHESFFEIYEELLFGQNSQKAKVEVGGIIENTFSNERLSKVEWRHL